MRRPLCHDSNPDGGAGSNVLHQNSSRQPPRQHNVGSAVPCSRPPAKWRSCCARHRTCARSISTSELSSLLFGIISWLAASWCTRPWDSQDNGCDPAPSSPGGSSTPHNGGHRSTGRFGMQRSKTRPKLVRRLQINQQQHHQHHHPNNTYSTGCPRIHCSKNVRSLPQSIFYIPSIVFMGTPLFLLATPSGELPAGSPFLGVARPALVFGPLLQVRRGVCP